LVSDIKARTLNRVLRRIFGSNRGEITGDWRKLHSEELHNLYSSPKIIRTIKSRKMIWAGHIAHVGGEDECIQGFVRKGIGKERTRKT
jgi:hypothetical protein